MPRQIPVIGHKNPDTDSVVSALANAELLRLQGEQEGIAARLGEVWREARYVQEGFGIPLVTLESDVRPLAREVMTTEPRVGRADESAYFVGRQPREHHIRAMPLADSADRQRGLIAVAAFAHILLTGLERDLLNQIHLEVGDIVQVWRGELPVVGMESQVAETSGQDFVSPHSATIGGTMSRKKQVVPVLPHVVRQRKTRS